MTALPVLLVMLLLLLPGSAQAELTERQERLLASNCLQCHSRDHTGAPLLGVAADWTTRNRQGEDALLRNVIEGVRGMPPSGYCGACDEADLRALIRHLSGLDGGR